jgi:alkylated DNA repair dioxygenase AlkB
VVVDDIERLSYMRGFLSATDGDLICRALDGGDWDTTLKRRVQHFGYRYDYRARTVTNDARLGPLPQWLGDLARRLVEHGQFDALPDQVIANEYLPGQGISAHIDCEPCFGGTIASLSLLSACEMVFRHAITGERRSVVLEPGSLLVLKGEARYGWTHEIPARASDMVDGIKRMRGRRVSLTFRNVVLGQEH